MTARREDALRQKIVELIEHLRLVREALDTRAIGLPS